jgi:hypothetical protein
MSFGSKIQAYRRVSRMCGIAALSTVRTLQVSPSKQNPFSLLAQVLVNAWAYIGYILSYVSTQFISAISSVIRKTKMLFYTVHELWLDLE